MSNENEVYYIEDIHPMDAHYHRRKELIGKKVTISHLAYNDGEWFGIYDCKVENDTATCFYQVKLTTATPPKKSFWQKLSTWGAWR